MTVHSQLDFDMRAMDMDKFVNEMIQSDRRWHWVVNAIQNRRP
jgi:hypothetical protein